MKITLYVSSDRHSFSFLIVKEFVEKKKQEADNILQPITTHVTLAFLLKYIFMVKFSSQHFRYHLNYFFEINIYNLFLSQKK